jgi:hypothetical protein
MDLEYSTINENIYVIIHVKLYLKLYVTQEFHSYLITNNGIVQKRTSSVTLIRYSDTTKIVSIL